MHSVLVVEDDPVIRNRLVNAVEQHPNLDVCAESGCYDEGLQFLVTHSPDVLLIDLGLPDGDGVDLIRAAGRLRKVESIVVTIFGDEMHVMRAIEAGASGYLLKNSGLDTVGNSIMEMLDGGAPISPAIARHLLRRFQGFRPDSAASDPSKSPLTVRELEVLTHISKGLNYLEISESLKISYHTVATHIKRIYRKLHVSSRSEAVYEAEQLGLIRIRE